MPQGSSKAIDGSMGPLTGPALVLVGFWGPGRARHSRQTFPCLGLNAQIANLGCAFGLPWSASGCWGWICTKAELTSQCSAPSRKQQ